MPNNNKKRIRKEDYSNKKNNGKEENDLKLTPPLRHAERPEPAPGHHARHQSGRRHQVGQQWRHRRDGE